jgi:hypothetical protein
VARPRKLPGWPCATGMKRTGGSPCSRHSGPSLGWDGLPAWEHRGRGGAPGPSEYPCAKTVSVRHPRPGAPKRAAHPTRSARGTRKQGSGLSGVAAQGLRHTHGLGRKRRSATLHLGFDAYLVSARARGTCDKIREARQRSQRSGGAGPTPWSMTRRLAPASENRRARTPQWTISRAHAVVDRRARCADAPTVLAGNAEAPHSTLRCIMPRGASRRRPGDAVPGSLSSA